MLEQCMADSRSMWSALTFEKPANPQSPHIQVPDFADDQQKLYQKYQEPIGQDQAVRSPFVAVIIAFYRTGLFRSAHAAINMYCGSRGRISAKSFLECLRKYLDWKEALPAGLKTETYEDNLPFPVATLQYVPKTSERYLLTQSSIQYYAAMVVHWLPLLSFLTDEFEDHNQVLFEECRSQLLGNAQQGMRLLRHSFSKKWHHYFTPPITLCSVHLCDVLAHWSFRREEKFEAVRLCCQMLDEGRLHSRFCGPLLQVFRIAVNQYANIIEISDELQHLYGNLNQYNISEVLNACTRPSYKMPVGQIVDRMHENFTSQWAEQWVEQMKTPRAQKRTSGNPMAVDVVMN